MKLQFSYYHRRRPIDRLVLLIGSYIRCSIRRLTILSVLTIIALPAHGSGRLQYFSTGDGVGNQEVNFEIFEDRIQASKRKNGNAFLYDGKFGRGGGFSMDYYTLSEIYDHPSVSLPIEKNDFYMLSLGYRYHFPLNFYLGAAAGIIVVEHNYFNDKITFLPSLAPAFTFGWTYVSPIKLAFGIHFLRTSATTLTSDDLLKNRLTGLAGGALCDPSINPISINPEDCDEVQAQAAETKEVDDFNMNLFGITLGFAW